MPTNNNYLSTEVSMTEIKKCLPSRCTLQTGMGPSGPFISVECVPAMPDPEYDYVLQSIRQIISAKFYALTPGERFEIWIRRDKTKPFTFII